MYNRNLIKAVCIPMLPLIALTGCGETNSQSNIGNAQAQSPTVVFHEGHQHDPSKAKFRYSSRVQGHNVIGVKMIFTDNGGGFSSGSYESHIANFGFANLDTMTTHWIFETYNQDIEAVITVPNKGYARYSKYDDENDGKELATGHILLVRDRDTNGDNKLNQKDTMQVMIIDPVGNALKPLLETRVSNLDYTHLEGTTAALTFEDKTGKKIARFNTATLEIEAIAPVPLP